MAMDNWFDLIAYVDEDPPTVKQVDLLHKWGYETPETKDEASKTIAAELEYRRNRGWREEEDDPRSADDADGWED